MDSPFNRHERSPPSVILSEAKDPAAARTTIERRKAFSLCRREWIFRLLLIVDKDIGEALAGSNEGPKDALVILRPALFAGRRIYGLVGGGGAAGRLHRSFGAKKRRLRMTSRGGRCEWDGALWGLKDRVVGGIAFIELPLDFAGGVVFFVLGFPVAVRKVVEIYESTIDDDGDLVRWNPILRD
jgi:hypothetical protein